MVSIECVFPNNRRYLWRIVDYLQRDAAAKGVRNSRNHAFDSSWHQLGCIAYNKDRVWVAIDSRNHHLVGYMVVNRWLGDLALVYGDILRVEYFEILPRHRRKGMGRRMMEWLKERAAAKQFGYIHVSHPLVETSGFWEALGFAERAGETGLWMKSSYQAGRF